MDNLTMTWPESLREFVEEQVAQGGFETPGAYLQALVREAQVRQARRQLETKILEGLQSPSREISDADWAELKQQIIDRSPELQGQ